MSKRGFVSLIAVLLVASVAILGLFIVETSPSGFAMHEVVKEKVAKENTRSCLSQQTNSFQSQENN